jgi:CRISPR-associated endonuclease/helicase Cas3
MPGDPILREVWAKSPSSPSRDGETLAEHTSWVLTRLADQRRLRPHMGDEVGEPRLWHRLYWAGFIHDWGKAARGFQDQVRFADRKWGSRHEVLSLAFVPYVAERQSEDALWIAAAVASHHRDEANLRERYNVATGLEAHYQQIEALVAEMEECHLAALWQWLTEFSWEWATSLGFREISRPRFPEAPESARAFRGRAVEEICAGLEEYYDWVQRLSMRFPADAVALAPLALRGLLITSDHSGSAHAPPFERVPIAPPPELLQRLDAQWRGAHPHQRACAAATGSILLVAPTGSGKTDGAKLWAANQRGPSGEPAPRLFYMLPYQASMNAMQRRLQEEFGEAQVGLQHGKARHALYRRYLEREQSPSRAAWASRAEQDLVKLHVPPVRVLSPYQILKAFYRLRGYEATLVDLRGALFVCDEIHAYEVKRLALILSMLGYLGRDFGVRFCLMSATFPSFLKRWLAEEIHPLNPVSATAETQARYRRHRVRLAPGDLTDDMALELVKEKASQGLSVLICCNTVSRAQRVWQRLRDAGLLPELLHSRFHAADRVQKERFLQERMGTWVAGADRRIVMVATQVVEVSLDIDFDVLFTDLAPLDALLQRLGRVNRRGRVPPCDVIVFGGPIEHERPYDEALLRGALAILEREFGQEGAVLDEARVSCWLDEVYTGDLADRWEAEYRRAKQEFEEVVLGSLYPFQSSTDTDLEERFYRAFDGTEVLPACLRERYRDLSEAEPLAASELLVPIRYAQLGRLRRQRAVMEPDEPGGVLVVDRPYSSELGLEL